MNHILIIEDEILIQQSLKKLFERRGIKVDVSASGKIAIDMILAHDYDRIICDLMLQDISGFDVIEEAKARFAQLSESIILILNEMNANTIKTKICLTCEGEGKLYEDTSRQCTKTPWQECCGGCGYEVTCETCDGTGEVEEEDEE